MAKPLVYYSVCSHLAYLINERYFGDVHYVWCSPHFSKSTVAAVKYTNPPSSTPAEIYRDYRKAVEGNDTHSPIIAKNITGILRGVGAHHNAKVINDAQKQEIEEILIVAKDQIALFRPVLYVMPAPLITKLLNTPAVSMKPHPLSEEYIIQRLPRRSFDLVDLYV